MSGHIIVCDIDGTISKVGDRIKYLEQEKKNWDSFYAHCGEDEPVEKVIQLVDNLVVEYYKVLFVSGRRESCRESTVTWIQKEMYLQCMNRCLDILLRSNHDFRPDTIVKKELLDKYLADNSYTKDDVAFILEDRSSVVKMWRENGYTCLQVAEGDF
jgi:hypothetical protein